MLSNICHLQGRGWASIIIMEEREMCQETDAVKDLACVGANVEFLETLLLDWNSGLPLCHRQ